MRIGLRLLLGFFLMLGLALFVVLRVFVEEVKPGTRQAMESSLVDTAYTLAALAAPDLAAGTMAKGQFARALTSLPGARPNALIWGIRKDQVALRITVTDARGIVVFDSAGRDVGQDHARWNDVARTLRGEYGARSSATGPDAPDDTVMHVAAPVRDGERLLGVLTVAQPNRTLEPYIQRSRDRILHWGWVLLGISLVAGLLFTWWIASSLARLRTYALRVAQGERAELPLFGRLSGNTEFTDLAQAVERMRLKLEDKAYIERYVHTLTHELKSPLAAMRGAAELLQEPLPELQRQRFAANIQRQTERLQGLIDKLLGLAELEQMRQLRDVEPVDLAVLTRELLSAAEPRWRQKGLQVDDRVTSQHPIEAAPVVRGNRFLIAQALQNMLDNAIDFSPHGGCITLQLARVADGARPGWQWTVQDQGPGIPDYARSRIFDRFYSLPRPDTGHKGTGLGLCLVQQVNALHGGELRVESLDSPSGCRATWRLPD